MNNQKLIPLKNKEIEPGKKILTVNARDLHKFLESKQDFSTWIKKRIKDYSFEECVDYVRFHKKMEANNATIIEYHISLSMAKELAMVERNDKGREIRKYFIKCEEELITGASVSNKDILLLQIWKTDGEDKRLAIDEYESKYVRPLENKVIEQEQQLINSKPKVEFYDLVVESSSTFSIEEVAKTLNYKGVGRNILFKILRDNKILDTKNKPYQVYVDKGWFRLIETTWLHPKSGDVMVNYKTVVYQRGVDCIAKLLTSLGYTINKGAKE